MPRSDFTHAGPSYGEAPAAPWMSLREHCIWRDSPVLHTICSGEGAGLPRGSAQECLLVLETSHLPACSAKLR